MFYTKFCETILEHLGVATYIFHVETISNIFGYSSLILYIVIECIFHYECIKNVLHKKLYCLIIHAQIMINLCVPIYIQIGS